MFGVDARCPGCGVEFKTCTPGVMCQECELKDPQSPARAFLRAMKKRYVWSWRVLGWVEHQPGVRKSALKVWRQNPHNHLWQWETWYEAITRHHF